MPSSDGSRDNSVTGNIFVNGRKNVYYLKIVLNTEFHKRTENITLRKADHHLREEKFRMSEFQ